jgi:hypothetical protein
MLTPSTPHQVPFAACLERWAGGSTLEDYHSAALGRKTVAHSAPRFAAFPPYLMVQLKKCVQSPRAACASQCQHGFKYPEHQHQSYSTSPTAGL